jgi:hypothetical protein
MAFDTMEHRDVAKINRIFERFVRLVTGFAFAIGQATEVNRVRHN